MTEYIVYNGEEYPRRSYDGNGYYLYTRDKKKLRDGFELYTESNPEKTYYRKYVLKESIEQRYCIIDYALINGRKYSIENISDEAFNKADSWVTVVSDDEKAMKEDGIWEGVEVEVEKYGHKYYHSSKIPADKVTLIRTRKILPLKK